MVAAPILVVCNAAASYEVNRKLNAKPGAYITMFDPQSGGPSLLSTNGLVWKHWRGLLNPGFAPGYLMSRADEFVDVVEIFADIMERRAKNKELFRLEDSTMRLTLETIMRISLYAIQSHGSNQLTDPENRKDDLNYQRKDHPVPRAIQTIIPLTSFGDLGLARFSPIRALKIRRCDRVLNEHFAEELNKRYDEYIEDPSTKNQCMCTPSILSTHSSSGKFN